MIIETTKTPSTAPPDWKPACSTRLKSGVQATSNEPFFEVGKKLTEGFTFAFRGRARNGAGYGGYSDVWVVEVV